MSISTSCGGVGEGRDSRCKALFFRLSFLTDVTPIEQKNHHELNYRFPHRILYMMNDVWYPYFRGKQNGDVC